MKFKFPETLPDRPLVYLAAPYMHPNRKVMLDRVDAINRAAGWLMREYGLCVFSPISHSHPIAEVSNLPGDWAYWQKYDEAFLSCCYLVIVLTLPGWKKSKGVQAEIKIAERMGIPVELMNPEE